MKDGEIMSNLSPHALYKVIDTILFSLGWVGCKMLLESVMHPLADRIK
jgi:hypothetical protein